MDVISVASQIEKAIMALGKEGNFTLGLVAENARAMAEYDKALGIEVASMKAAGHPVTTIEKIAKGNVSEHLYEKVLAEGTLKANYAKLDQIKAQLNGLQSIYRHLDNR